MADLGDGYARIANELLEELAQRKLNSTQASIVFFIFRHTYGFQRKCHEMSLNYLAEGIGANRDQIKRGMKELIELNVVRVFEEASFSKSRVIGLNSECSEWKLAKYRGPDSTEGAIQYPPKKKISNDNSDLVPDNEILPQGTNQPPVEGTESPPRVGANQPPKERYSFKDNIKDIIYTIFEHWNSKKIIVHRELTQVRSKAINARLKVSSKEDILEAIDNYDFCLRSDAHYYTHKFDLKDFMNPKNIEKFLSENDPLNNFKKRWSQNKNDVAGEDDFRKRLEEKDRAEREQNDPR
ncbi:replication protein [Paenibacillus massiliensis]|uniref:replication protein n=1 Tax=Paenibacillus massiliensis TaxID=225917 RepID=UPI00046F1BED|nr:replication protein [Paenibacillus massiliensis]